MLDLEDQILLAKGVELTEVQTLSQIMKLSNVFALKLGDIHRNFCAGGEPGATPMGGARTMREVALGPMTRWVPVVSRSNVWSGLAIRRPNRRSFDPGERNEREKWGQA